MQLIKPSIEFEWMTPEPLKAIERAGRTCWKSEGKVEVGSAERFVRMLLVKKHYAMIEHASASYRVICDRGVTHEIVRHRLFSYAQESTRYCNYSTGVTFIIPLWLYDDLQCQPGERTDFMGSPQSDAQFWLTHMLWSEKTYTKLLAMGWSPQKARSVLSNSLKTEIVITGNLREWLHFFSLRTNEAAHPQMREVAFMILKDIKQRIPVIFDLEDKYVRSSS